MKVKTYKVSVKERRPPKPYDSSMWTRRCPKGVRSCFKAVGNWDSQKPVFRGCAGARYDHGNFCKREMQTVEVVPGQPRVDVEVYLCYCSGDECNKTDIDGAHSLAPAAGLLAVLAIFLLTSN